MNLSLDKKIDFLRRLNQVQIGGIPIYQKLMFRHYTIWAFVQQHLWIDINLLGERPSAFLSSEKRFQWRNLALNWCQILLTGFSLLILLIKRPSTALYTPDITVGSNKNDPRLDGFYKFLHEHKISFFEVVHAPLNKKFLVNFFRRRRPVIYLESIGYLRALIWKIKPFRYFADFPGDVIDLGLFSEEEKPIARGLIVGHFQRADLIVFRMIILQKILRILGIKKFLSIDDMRYAQEMLLAAHLAGTKAYMFQHGRFNKYIVGHMNYGIPAEICFVPDKFFVFNEYWKNKLIDSSDTYNFHKDKLLVGTAPASQLPFKSAYALTRGDTNTVMVPYELAGDRNAIKQFMGALLNCPNIHVIFKLRQDSPRLEQLRHMGLEEFLEHQRFEICTEMNEDIFSRISVVIGTYSTMLYEMIAVGRPVGIIKTQYPELADLIKDDLAVWIDLDGDICQQVDNLAKTDTITLMRRAQTMGSGGDINKTLRNIFGI